MSVYIKGIEIPTDNTVLLRVFPASESGECYTQQLAVDGDVLAEYWAIPVPPHGRLIDADALCAKDNGDFETAVSMVASVSTKSAIIRIHEQMQAVISEAPTIIPADKEVDDG